MTSAQKVIKYLAIGFAIFLIVTIISSILTGFYALSGMLGLKNDSKVSNEDMSITNFENVHITNLNIDVAYTNLTIKKGKYLSIETNSENISCMQEDQNLQIKEQKHNFFSNDDISELIIYIPEELELENVSIITGAGKIYIEKIVTNKLSFELGAGETTIESLNVSKECNVEGGAGKVDILSGEINNLDLDMGVGKINLKADITGKSNINAGIGNLNIELQNDEESYRIDVDKGIGTIKIDGKDITDNKTYGNGKNYIEIDGGIGNIEVDFKKF